MDIDLNQPQYDDEEYLMRFNDGFELAKHVSAAEMRRPESIRHDERERRGPGQDRRGGGRDRRRPGSDRREDIRHLDPSSGSGMPRENPPNFTPDEPPGLRAVDPGAIRGCMESFTFVWAKNGQSFWFYPTFVGRRSVSGYRWTRFGWIYTGFDLELIRSFTCKRPR